MVWVLPTLSRPEQCLRVIAQLKKTGCSSPGIVYVNGHIGYYSYFKKLYHSSLPDNWHIFTNKDNVGALGALSSVFKMYPDEPFYGFIGDDEFVETEGWDRALIEAAGDWNISHGNDGFNNGRRAQGYLCIGGRLAQTVGYLTIPEAWHWYGLDDMWEQLAFAGACEKRYLDTVYIKHLHPMHGAGEMDECYELGASRKEIDQQIFFHWLRTQMPGIAEYVKKVKRP